MAKQASARNWAGLLVVVRSRRLEGVAVDDRRQPEAELSRRARRQERPWRTCAGRSLLRSSQRKAG
jgi:hypothetical protein